MTTDDEWLQQYLRTLPPAQRRLVNPVTLTTGPDGISLAEPPAIAAEPIDTPDGYTLDALDDDLDRAQADELLGDRKPLYFLSGRALDLRQDLERDITQRERASRPSRRWAKPRCEPGQPRRPRRSHAEVVAELIERDYAWVQKRRPWLLPHKRTRWTAPRFYSGEAEAELANERLHGLWLRREERRVTKLRARMAAAKERRQRAQEESRKQAEAAFDRIFGPHLDEIAKTEVPSMIPSVPLPKPRPLTPQEKALRVARMIHTNEAMNSPETGTPPSERHVNIAS